MQPDRISRDSLLMGIAELYSRRGTCGRLQVGCTITRNGRTISSGYNGPLPYDSACSTSKCDITTPCNKSIHAEANAIAAAAKEGISLAGTVIYCTHSPCITCASLIIQSGITEVIYKELFRDNAGLLLLTTNNIKVSQYAQ